MPKSIFVRLTSRQLTTVIHALQEEVRRVQEAGGNQYGAFSLEEATQLISHLLSAQVADTAPDDGLAFAY